MIIINMNNSTEKVHNASQRKHIAFDCTGRSKQHERVMLCTQKCVSINSIRNEENIEYQRKMMNSSNRTYTASDKSPFNTFSYTGNMKMVKPLEQHRDKKMEQDKKNNSKYSDAFKGYQEELQESFVPINHFNYRSFHFNIDKANRKETQSRIQKAIHDKKDIESYNDYSQKKRSHSIAGSITNPSFLISRPRNHSMLRKVIGNSQKFRQFQNNLKAKIFVVSLTDLMRNNAQQEEKKNVKKQEIQIQKNGSIEINSAFETIKQVNNDSQRNNKQFHIHHPHKRNILMHRNEKHINIIEPVFIEPPKLPIKGWSNIQQQATISNLQQFQN